MSLSQKIVAAVDQTGGSRSVSVEDAGHRLSIVLDTTGPVGLAFTNLTFSQIDPDPAGWSADQLETWGGKLASRLTYLMEPLSILEHDHEAGELILRSQSPTPRADQHSYSQIRLDRQGTLTLTRVAFDQASRRRHPIPCQMTLEVLERLTDDLVSTSR